MIHFYKRLFKVKCIVRIIMWISLFFILGLCQYSHEGLHHLLAKKFIGAKLFKKMKVLNQCDVKWENAVHPHCETTWEKDCKPEVRQECSTEYEDKCTKELERKCNTKKRQECETLHIDMCETEAVEHCIDTVENVCETKNFQECWEEDEEDCKTVQHCGTKFENVCSTISKWICDKPEALKPEPEPEKAHVEPEPESTRYRSVPHAEPSGYAEPEPTRFRRGAGVSVYTNPLKNVMKAREVRVVKNMDDEMVQRFEATPMRDLLELADDMTEDDFKDDSLSYQYETQAALRSKRSSLGHIAGLVGLSALYKKFLSTQDECRQVQAPHCTQVPVEACHNERQCSVKKVPKCRKVPQEVCQDVPKEQCWTEPKQTCWVEPKEKCWDVPEEICWDEPKEKCWKEPQEVCWQVVDEKCVDLPVETCQDVNVKVAKRVCEKENGSSSYH